MGPLRWWTDTYRTLPSGRSTQKQTDESFPTVIDTKQTGQTDYSGGQAAAYSREVNFTAGPDREITDRYLGAIPPSLTGKRVLDLACGGGELPNRVLANRNPAGVVGVDISPDFIAQAIRDMPPYPGMTYVVGDMNHLPLPDKSMDLVVSRFGLHYAEDLARLFRSVSNVLKPGGELVYLTNMARSSDSDEVPATVAREGWIPIQLSENVRVNNRAHSREDYMTAMRAAGLQVDFVESCNADGKIAPDYAHRNEIHLDATIVRAHRLPA